MTPDRISTAAGDHNDLCRKFMIYSITIFVKNWKEEKLLLEKSSILTAWFVPPTWRLFIVLWHQYGEREDTHT